MRKEFSSQLREELKWIDIELSEQQIDQFYQYYELLIQWNSMINLTAITEMKEVITKHFVDSLSIVKVKEDLNQKGYHLIDVGTGAGFPGIPLKIVYPDLKVTLLDSLNKRVKFLEDVINKLNLYDIQAIHGRAEDIGKNNVSRETFDICVSRAVANLSTLSEYCIPFVKVGGCFISYKSGKLEEELIHGKGAIKKLGGMIEKIVTFQLPNSDERSLVMVKKETVTKKKYPRKAGMPSKEPLN